MQIYFPIAEISVDALVILGMGGAVGFLSGLFGVGGGFLITPLLIFSGVPAAVAVATGANQLIATSISGALAQWRRGNVDVKLGLVLVAGGLAGSALGVIIVRILRESGQIEFIISLLYVVLLGGVGGLMIVESVRAISKASNGRPTSVRRPGQHGWVHGLPFKMRFKRSKLFISAAPVFAIGFVGGLLAATMGVGGGFIMVPAMIYLLRVPTNVVVGTSLFQIIFVTSAATVLHAFANQTVDVLLAVILMLGGVVGAQLGADAGQKLRAEHLRALLALLVLGVGARLLVDLIATPSQPFSIDRSELA
ncbi:MAG: sulfite exporter TauE/SafE family protein [Hyphomicrobiales bacterium]|nr:sulfite exporter TauE/SafE family protein [Hyphomicrobiales bacterium]